VILETEMFSTEPGDVAHDDGRYDVLIVGGMAFDKTCFAASRDRVIQDTGGKALVGYETTCKPYGAMDLVLYGGERIAFTAASDPSDC
jgi:hypothetical protein